LSGFDFTNIFRLNAGKYSANSPGKALISFTKDTFSLPGLVYMDILGAVGAHGVDSIDCNVTTPITFTIGGVTLEVGHKRF
jgi:hypothetical protein